MGEVGAASLTKILNPDVTDGSPVGRHPRSRLVYNKARIFSFVDMLPLKLTKPIL